MKEHRLTYLDLNNAELPYQLAPQCQPGDAIVLTLEDGDTLRMQANMALVNFILLRPYVTAGLQLRLSDFFVIDILSAGTIRDYLTMIYDRLITERMETPHTEFLALVWDVVANKLPRFARECAIAHQQTIDILGLMRLMHHPKIKPIVTVELPPNTPSNEVEKLYAERAAQLTAVLTDPTVIPPEENQMHHFATVGHLSSVKTPQNMIMYGTRSMIDGTIPTHAITESAISGLVTPADVGVEALAAIKSAWYSKDTICDTQYNARLMRICASFIRNIYPGSCGSNIGIPFVIPQRGASNFLANAYWDGPNLQYITKKNLPKLIGNKVMLVSPITCRHTDGICERCAGWGYGRAIKYFPQGINIGVMAATRVGGPVGQLLLSAKHLSKTSSVIYMLPDTARSWFITGQGKIFLNPDRHESVSKLQMLIPVHMLNIFADIDQDVIAEAENFSQIRYLYLGAIDSEYHETVQVATESCLPYLSGEFLAHLKNVRRHCQVVDSNLVVPLNGWDPRAPMMMYTQVSADMLAFTGAVDSFFDSKLAEYSSASVALADLSNLLYSKLDINFFYLQVLMKAFLRTPNDFRIPQITDPDKVAFFTMRALVPARSSTTVFGFENVRDYVYNPASYLMDKSPNGIFDPFFGDLRNADMTVDFVCNDEDDDAEEDDDEGAEAKVLNYQ